MEELRTQKLDRFAYGHSVSYRPGISDTSPILVYAFDLHRLKELWTMSSGLLIPRTGATKSMELLKPDFYDGVIFPYARISVPTRDLGQCALTSLLTAEDRKGINEQPGDDTILEEFLEQARNGMKLPVNGGKYSDSVAIYDNSLFHMDISGFNRIEMSNKLSEEFARIREAVTLFYQGLPVRTILPPRPGK